MSGRSEWRDRAACRNTAPETFFPSAAAGPIYEAQVATAKAVCAGCPVRAECLTEMARVPFGIAGGLTPEERRTHRPDRAEADQAAVLAAGLAPGADRAQVAAAGRVLLAAGRPAREVAQLCGVSERTASRWAARITTPRTSTGAGGTTSTGRGAA